MSDMSHTQAGHCMGQSKVDKTAKMQLKALMGGSVV